MALWNPSDLIPGPVRDMAGILGLAALGAAAVTIVVASWVAARRPASDTDNPTGELFSMSWAIAKILVTLGAMLLLIWSLPWLMAHSNNAPWPILTLHPEWWT